LIYYDIVSHSSITMTILYYSRRQLSIMKAVVSNNPDVARMICIHGYQHLFRDLHYVFRN